MNGDLVVAALVFTWSTRPETRLHCRALVEGGVPPVTAVVLSLLAFGKFETTDITDFSYCACVTLSDDNSVSAQETSS
jgi:hypothetical protein